MPIANEPPTQLPLLLDAIWADKIIKMRYGSTPHPTRIAPYGLVRKGIRWYVIGHGEDKLRMYRVSRIHELVTTEESFDRPAGFDLARHWRQEQQKYAERFASFPVRLRLRGEALIRAGWAYARSRTFAEPDDDGWVDAEFDTEDWDGAVGLVGALGGADVIITAPERLRHQMITGAARLLELNQP